MPDGCDSRQPVSVPKTRITSFAHPGGPSGLSALGGTEVKATEGQILSVMSKTPQIAAFGHDNQADDGADAGDGPQAMVIGIAV